MEQDRGWGRWETVSIRPSSVSGGYLHKAHRRNRSLTHWFPHYKDMVPMMDRFYHWNRFDLPFWKSIVVHSVAGNSLQNHTERGWKKSINRYAVCCGYYISRRCPLTCRKKMISHANYRRMCDWAHATGRYTGHGKHSTALACVFRFTVGLYHPRFGGFFCTTIQFVVPPEYSSPPDFCSCAGNYGINLAKNSRNLAQFAPKMDRIFTSFSCSDCEKVT